MRSFLSLSLGILSLYATAFGSEIVLDRYIVEVKNISYTQRQLLAFDSIRSVIEVDLDQKFSFVTKDNWWFKLNEFKNAMIIEQESLRISSFKPNPRTFERLAKKVSDRKQSDLIFAEYLKTYEIDAALIGSSINTVLRVQRYVEGRKGVTKSNGFQSINNLSQYRWFKALMERTPYRFYEKANHYVDVTPNKAFGKSL